MSSESGRVCSCEGEPITVDTPVDEGFTPAELVTLAQQDPFEAEWLGLAGSPMGTFTYSVTYEGGAVADEPGGCCGNFMCSPCPFGATVDVRLDFSSANGMFAESMVATLNGDLSKGSEEFTIRAEWQMRDVQGTANTQPFEVEGEPFNVETLFIELRWPFSFGDPSLPGLEIRGVSMNDGIIIVDSDP